MSTPLDRELDPDDASPFAPKTRRAIASAEPRGAASGMQQPVIDPELRSWSATAASAAENGDLPCPEPSLMPEAWQVPRRSSKSGMFLCFSFAMAVAAIGAPFVADELPQAATPAVAVLSVSQEAPLAPRKQDEAFPLAVTAGGSGAGANVVIDRLATGSTLTVGGPLGPNGWRLAASDLPSALVRPPQGFVGAMDIVVELRLADETLLDRKSLRLEWVTAAPGQWTGRPIRQLDRHEIADLVRRGNQLIIRGDLASARLVLQRAAEGGDPPAALMLAGTYDPILLAKVGIQGFARDIVEGFAPDIALARTWYERAKELGSTEATRRLEILGRTGIIEPRATSDQSSRRGP